MPAAISTSLSDAVLALSAFYSAYHLKEGYDLAAYGFASVAMAASMGVIRFGLDNPQDIIIKLHKTLAWISGVVIGPCIAGSYYINNQYNAIILILILLTCTVVGDEMLSSTGDKIATSIVSTVGVVSVIAWNSWSQSLNGIFGGLLYALAGVAIGTNGYMIGIPRVDIFHYTLALANIWLLRGLQEK